MMEKGNLRLLFLWIVVMPNVSFRWRPWTEGSAFAGIEDVSISSRESTKTLGNFIKALPPVDPLPMRNGLVSNFEYRGVDMEFEYLHRQRIRGNLLEKAYLDGVNRAYVPIEADYGENCPAQNWLYISWAFISFTDRVIFNISILIGML